MIMPILIFIFLYQRFAFLLIFKSVLLFAC
jgi:hypothetical protein